MNHGKLLGAGVFSLNSKHYLCTVENHSMFPLIKEIEGFIADNLTKGCMIIFAEYGLQVN